MACILSVAGMGVGTGGLHPEKMANMKARHKIPVFMGIPFIKIFCIPPVLYGMTVCRPGLFTTYDPVR